jgi:hypothetical protein
MFERAVPVGTHHVHGPYPQAVPLRIFDNGSDGQLRTDYQIVDEMFAVLGFS